MGPDNRSPYWLLVEGSNDMWSVIELVSRHGYDWNDARRIRPFVHNARGDRELLQQLPTALKAKDRLGVVLDADEHPARRWQSLRDRVKPEGVILPPEPDADGTIVPTKRGTFGVWLMPDNRATGTLENLLVTLLPEADRPFRLAQAATRRARRLGAPLPEKDHLKGTLSAWLAWRDPPGLPYGAAISAKMLGSDSTSARALVAWFRRLFESDVVG